MWFYNLVGEWFLFLEPMISGILAMFGTCYGALGFLSRLMVRDMESNGWEISEIMAMQDAPSELLILVLG